MIFFCRPIQTVLITYNVSGSCRLDKLASEFCSFLRTNASHQSNLIFSSCFDDLHWFLLKLEPSAIQVIFFFQLAVFLIVERLYGFSLNFQSWRMFRK